MNPIVEKCLNEIIISCQAYEDTPLYGANNMKKMVECAIIGGAKAVRCCWPQDIAAARSLSDDLIIIGINKVMSPDRTPDTVFITPTFEKAEEVIKAGADIVALDCRITKSRGKDELLDLLKSLKEKYPDVPLMADCGTFEEGMIVAESGYMDILSTTLSGNVRKMTGPDIELLKLFKQNSTLPVNAEGRIWELADIKAVKEAGADMLTIGTAVTRPHLIAKRFIDYYRELNSLN